MTTAIHKDEQQLALPVDERWKEFVTTTAGSTMIDMPFRYEAIALSRLIVDYHEDFLSNGQGAASAAGYQRKRDKITDRIVRDGFDPDLLGVFIVNQRSEDLYAVADGGSRYRALIRLNFPSETKVPCLVYQWDELQEIINYVRLNEERAGLTPVDLFLAKVKYGEETAVAINSLLVDITRSGVSPKDSGWRCVAALEKAYKRQNLRTILIVLERLKWLEMPGGRTQNIIGAVDDLLYVGASPDVMVARWATYTPMLIANEAKAWRKDYPAQSRSVAKAFARVLAGIYNKNQRGGGRIDVARLMPSTQDDAE